MGENKLIPMRRFKEYSKVWHMFSLDEVYKNIKNAFVGTATPYYVESGHFYLQSNNVKNGKINKNVKVYINNEFYKKQENNWLRTGDIVMVQSGHIGHTAVIEENLDKTVAHALIMFQGKKEKLDSNFLNNQFQTKDMKQKLEKMAIGNTIKHILSSDMKKFNVYLTTLSEQQKIGEFFKVLDERIANQERKIAKVKDLKSAYLTEMFPQEGETIPKRRFKGFKGKWHKKTLGDFGTVEMNKRIFKEQTSIIGDVPFYKIGTFGKQADAFISYELFNEYKTKYPYPNPGDILISAAGSIGRTVAYQGENAYYQDSNIVWLKHDGKLSNLFLKQFYKFTNWSSLEGSTIKRLYNRDILEAIIHIPSSIKEQQKIGEFFKNLDNQIETEEKKLDKLQKMKEAYLEEMFV